MDRVTLGCVTVPVPEPARHAKQGDKWCRNLGEDTARDSGIAWTGEPATARLASAAGEDAPRKNEEHGKSREGRK
ncbi:hypothetical protein TURU_008411 [Turdus rufiventris]|nr:hypothetical protein TURU_008411 [Turdus rufiventris]